MLLHLKDLHPVHHHVLGSQMTLLIYLDGGQYCDIIHVLTHLH